MSHGPRYKAVLELLPHKIRIGEREVTLTVGQATLFKQLYENGGKICSKSSLAKAVEENLTLAGVARKRSNLENMNLVPSVRNYMTHLRTILDNANPNEFPNLSEIFETIADMGPLPKSHPERPRYEGGYRLRVNTQYTLTLKNKIYTFNHNHRATPA